MTFRASPCSTQHVEFYLSIIVNKYNITCITLAYEDIVKHNVQEIIL